MDQVQKIKSLPLRDYISLSYELLRQKKAKYKMFTSSYAAFNKKGLPKDFIFFALTMPIDIPLFMYRAKQIALDYSTPKERSQFEMSSSELENKWKNIKRELSIDENVLVETFNRQFTKSQTEQLQTVFKRINNLEIGSSDLSYNITDMFNKYLNELREGIFTRIEYYEKANVDLNSKLRNVNWEYATIMDVINKEFASLNNNIDGGLFLKQLSSQLTSLKQTYANYTNNFQKNIDAISLLQKIQQLLSSTVGEQQKVNDETLQLVNRLKDKDAELVKINDTLLKTEIEKNNLLKEIENKNEYIKETREKYETMLNENNIAYTALKARNDFCEKEIIEYRDTLAKYKTEIDFKQVGIVEVNQRSIELFQETVRLKDELANKNTQIEELKHQLENIIYRTEQAAGESQRNYEELLQKYQTEITLCKDNIFKYESELTDRNNRILEINNAYELLKINGEELLNHANNEIIVLNNNFQEIRQLNENLEREKETINKTLLEKDKMIETLNETVSVLRDKENQYNETLNEIENLKKELKGEENYKTAIGGIRINTNVLKSKEERASALLKIILSEYLKDLKEDVYVMDDKQIFELFYLLISIYNTEDKYLNTLLISQNIQFIEENTLTTLLEDVNIQSAEQGLLKKLHERVVGIYSDDSIYNKTNNTHIKNIILFYTILKTFLGPILNLDESTINNVASNNYNIKLQITR